MALDFVEKHVPAELLTVIKEWKEKDQKFIELRDCSAEFQFHFLNAWKVSSYSNNPGLLISWEAIQI